MIGNVTVLAIRKINTVKLWKPARIDAVQERNVVVDHPVVKILNECVLQLQDVTPSIGRVANLDGNTLAVQLIPIVVVFVGTIYGYWRHAEVFCVVLSRTNGIPDLVFGRTVAGCTISVAIQAPCTFRPHSQHFIAVISDDYIAMLVPGVDYWGLEVVHLCFIR
jgi:hypothetical protein